MNLYIRYFDDEAIVTSVDEALAFISTFQDFHMTEQFIEDFRQYAEGPMPYPKRYKVHSRIYFIVIKTTASTIEEFKANGKNKTKERTKDESSTEQAQVEQQRPMPHSLIEEQPGWYEGNITFKRVVMLATGKFDTVDTAFTARVKAHSPQDCYNQIIDYLHSRSDIDARSQYPSIRGKNFQYTYLGIKPLHELPI